MSVNLSYFVVQHKDYCPLHWLLQHVFPDESAIGAGEVKGNADTLGSGKCPADIEMRCAGASPALQAPMEELSPNRDVPSASLRLKAWMVVSTRGATNVED